MKELNVNIPVKVYSFEELSEGDRNLVDSARRSTFRAYAPYSRFHVGAAILLENGEIVTGANQENAAFPSGTCAERTAAFYASARYPGVAMKKIAIAAWQKPENNLPEEDGFQKNPISPCGGCRQALVEYEHLYGPIEVILYGTDKIYVLPSVSSLLPFTFVSF